MLLAAPHPAAHAVTLSQRGEGITRTFRFQSLVR